MSRPGMNDSKQVAWPYDAPKDDPLTRLRIPVTSLNPEWIYLACLSNEGERPTDNEAASLACYIDYQREHWFNETYQRKLSARPFDIDGGHNTTIFHKYGTDDWGHRKRTWTMGPRIWPSYDRKEHLTLVALMDHLHTFTDHLYKPWAEWKAAHPEVRS